MKKAIILLLALVLAFGVLSGCGRTGTGTPDLMPGDGSMLDPDAEDGVVHDRDGFLEDQERTSPAPIITPYPSMSPSPDQNQGTGTQSGTGMQPEQSPTP